MKRILALIGLFVFCSGVHAAWYVDGDKQADATTAAMQAQVNANTAGIAANTAGVASNATALADLPPITNAVTREFTNQVNFWVVPTVDGNALLTNASLVEVDPIFGAWSNIWQATISAAMTNYTETDPVFGTWSNTWQGKVAGAITNETDPVWNAASGSFLTVTRHIADTNILLDAAKTDASSKTGSLAAAIGYPWTNGMALDQYWAFDGSKMVPTTLVVAGGIWSSGANKAWLDGSTNVGIGIATPAAPLHISRTNGEFTSAIMTGRLDFGQNVSLMSTPADNALGWRVRLYGDATGPQYGFGVGVDGFSFPWAVGSTTRGFRFYFDNGTSYDLGITLGHDYIDIDNTVNAWYKMNGTPLLGHDANSHYCLTNVTHYRGPTNYFVDIDWSAFLADNNTTNAALLHADYTPVNYTPTGGSISGHLAGIDTKLGSMPSTNGLASETWVNAQGFAKDGDSPTFDVVTADDYKMSGNTDSAIWTTVFGTNNSIAAGCDGSSIMGGRLNNMTAADTGADYSFIGGGYDNDMGDASYSFIGGGRLCEISIGMAPVNYNVIVGGYDCDISVGEYNFVGGGQNSDIIAADVSETHNTLVGGKDCSIGGGGGGAQHNFLGGGNNNDIETQGLGSYQNVLCGGNVNKVDGIANFLGGGSNNELDPGCQYTVLCGGYQNEGFNSQYGGVLCGRASHSSNQFAVAAGYKARALHKGSWIITDCENSVFNSTVTNEFAARFSSGYRLTGGPCEVENASSGKDAVNYQTMTDYVAVAVSPGIFYAYLEAEQSNIGSETATVVNLNMKWKDPLGLVNTNTHKVVFCNNAATGVWEVVAEPIFQDLDLQKQGQAWIYQVSESGATTSIVAYAVGKSEENNSEKSMVLGGMIEVAATNDYIYLEVEHNNGASDVDLIGVERAYTHLRGRQIK